MPFWGNRLIRIFHEVFSAICFVQIAQSVVVLAVTIVAMTSTKLTLSVLIGKIVYLSIVFSQNLFFCYFSNEVFFEVISWNSHVDWINGFKFDLQSTKLSMNAFSSDFMKFDIPTKKKLLFLIHVTGSYPSRISALGWCILDLSLLLSVSNGSKHDLVKKSLYHLKIFFYR